MKRIFNLLLLVITSWNLAAQTNLSLAVGGDTDKFYPVVFLDAAWYGNRPTELVIGRSNVHADEQWRGSLMATFKFHTTQWGNASHFIDADIRQFNHLGAKPMIARWEDISEGNGLTHIAVWLRGGTTYTLTSAFNVTASVYDNVHNPLPYQIPNGAAISFITNVEPYVNSFGLSTQGSIYARGNSNYFSGNVGIGIVNPPEKLAVNGKILATEVKVAHVSNWPDYVFKPGYNKASLKEIANFISKNGHLPEIPSAAAVEKDGLQLGEMNKSLLKKVEELTLHLIEKERQINSLEARLQKLEQLLKYNKR